MDEPAPASTSVDDGEQSLLAGLRAGDESAFERVVRLYSPRLLAATRRILQNEDDALDAVQETFLSAFRSLDNFAGQARFSTWLHRIAVNAALMKLRTRKRKPERSIGDFLPSFLEDGHQAHPTSWDSADRALERQETRNRVRTAIDELPESY